MRVARSPRSAFASIALILVTFGCGGRPASPETRPEKLHLTSACDLVPGAGLEWVLDAHPRAIADTADLMPAIALLLPEEKLSQFAEGTGGVDLRTTADLCIARYRDTTLLSVARAPFDPNRVERAFAARSSRLLARTQIVQRPSVVAVEGDVQGARERVALFAGSVVALEQGPGDPLRASFAFAREKLRRSTRALEAPGIARAAELLGEAPLRFVTRGPFGDAASVHPMWRTAEGMAVGASFAGKPARLAVRLVVTGPWKGHEREVEGVARRMAENLAGSALGRLMGLGDLRSRIAVRVTEEALVVDAETDGLALARGIHHATFADIRDILALPAPGGEAPP